MKRNIKMKNTTIGTSSDDSGDIGDVTADDQRMVVEALRGNNSPRRALANPHHLRLRAQFNPQRHPVYQMHKSAVAPGAGAGLDCASVSDETTIITSTTTTPTLHYTNARPVAQHLNQKNYMINIDYFVQL